MILSAKMFNARPGVRLKQLAISANLTLERSPSNSSTPPPRVRKTWASKRKQRPPEWQNKRTTPLVLMIHSSSYILPTRQNGMTEKLCNTSSVAGDFPRYSNGHHLPKPRSDGSIDHVANSSSDRASSGGTESRGYDHSNPRNDLTLNLYGTPSGVGH
jgi:hypothetical protein